MNRFYPKYWLFFAAIFAFSVETKAQNNRFLDSLKNRLFTANDTQRLDIYSQLAYNYSETKRDSSIKYCDKTISLARRLNQPYYEAYFLFTRAYGNSRNNYPDSWNDLYLATKLTQDKDIGENILKTTFSQKSFPNRDPETNRLILLSYIKNNWGVLYSLTRNIPKSFSEYFEAKNIAEASTYVDKLLLSAIYINISQSYLSINKLDSALYFQKLGLEAQIGTKNDIYSGSNVAVMGDIHLLKGELTAARDSLIRGLQLIEQQEFNNVVGIAQTYLSLSDYYWQVNAIDSALYYAQLSFNHFQSMDSPTDLGYAAYSLSQIYADKNNYDSAYFYLNISKNISDSLQNLEIERLNSFQNLGFENQFRLQELEKEKMFNNNKNRLYALLAILTILVLIAITLYYFNRRRRKTNRILKKALSDLKSTQAQLIQSEKLASLGELTAGIAHEIQNPLNFVNNFSELSVDLIKEIQEERQKIKENRDEGLENELLADLSSNQEKINHHGKRASSIVKGMLEHSRTSTGVKELTDINKLADEYLRLSYHGIRAKDKDFNADFTTEFDENLPKIAIIPQDMGRVLLNLINNAFYAVNQRNQLGSSSELEPSYTPSVSVITQQLDNQIIIKVKDNGIGMSEAIKAKVFQPFFTTKPTGQGTGLGLSLAYDIVTKGHGGTLEAQSTEGVGSEFIIKLSF